MITMHRNSNASKKRKLFVFLILNSYYIAEIKKKLHFCVLVFGAAQQQTREKREEMGIFRFINALVILWCNFKYLQGFWSSTTTNQRKEKMKIYIFFLWMLLIFGDAISNICKGWIVLLAAPNPNGKVDASNQKEKRQR